jgi:UDP-galactopyranose mutase
VNRLENLRYSRHIPWDVDTLVVGAGFAGAVMAERLRTVLGQKVLVIDRRDHIGGNAYDYVDENGVLIHRYGPHIFHTNAPSVSAYLSNFTEWRPYEHRVLARLDNEMYPIPINRTTINKFYGLSLETDEQVEAFFAEIREDIAFLKNSEDAVVAKVGRPLYEQFFRDYTRKQWAQDPSELHASVCARIPVRTNADDRYFTDSFQNMPAAGYTKMFERLLAGVEVLLGVDFNDIRDSVSCKHIVFTGPIDGFFEYRYGKLPYRSLEFETRVVETPGRQLVQPVGTVNEPKSDVPHTRTTEYRHLTGQSHTMTTMHLEHPRTEGDPYYPIPRDDTRALYKQYDALATARPDVTFIGRLGRYQYLNMDQVVAQALTTFEKHRTVLLAA